MDSLRIILVEDDNLTRDTIHRALSKRKVDVLLATSSTSEALDFAKKNRPDAAVIDFNLGVGPNGIDLAVGLRRSNPNIGIVLLTAFLNPAQLPAMIAKLPEGGQYLIKHSVSDIEILVQSIRESLNPRTNH